MSTISKICTRCQCLRPLSEYYTRSGMNADNVPGHYNSECKICMKARSMNLIPLSPYQPRVYTEQVAIDRLLQEGIFAIPGKAIHAADVDVVCWGCVWVEVKYSVLQRGYFKFATTPKQQIRGFLADLVMLVCDYGDVKTYHIFESNDPVFYMKGRLKSAFQFTPGALEAKKHANNRIVMVQPMMDAAQDRWDLIEHHRITNPLKHLTHLQQGNNSKAG